MIQPRAEERFTKSLQWALDHHASVVNTKSCKIPNSWLSRVQEFNRRLGYRIQLNSLNWSKKDFILNLLLDWENIGVAPPYFDSKIKIALLKGTTIVRAKEVNIDTRKWLPGLHQTIVAVDCRNLTPSTYKVVLRLSTMKNDFIHIGSKLLREGSSNKDYYYYYYVLGSINI